MAAVGIAASVALVRAERELTRRGERPRAPEPPPPPGPAPTPPEQTHAPVQRAALRHIDAAIELLESYPRRPAPEREETVHEVRKALKRVRALLRLLRPQLGDGDFERENAALRDCGRQLSGARDAEVMVATLDDLARRHPGKPTRGRGVKQLRAELVAERERALGVEDPALRAAALDELRRARERIALWQLPPRGAGKKKAARLLEDGLRDVYATGRRRRRKARRREDLETLHALRKSAKDLRYVAETLHEGEPGAGRPGTGKAPRVAAGRDATGRKARRARRRMRRVARRADRLGEMLGEEHDLALLREVVRERFDGGRRPRRRLLKLIARRRRRLRRRSLELADGLYRRKPGRFARRLRRAL